MIIVGLNSYVYRIDVLMCYLVWLPGHLYYYYYARLLVMSRDVCLSDTAPLFDSKLYSKYNDMRSKKRR